MNPQDTLNADPLRVRGKEMEKWPVPVLIALFMEMKNSPFPTGSFECKGLGKFRWTKKLGKGYPFVMHRVSENIS